MSEAAGRTPETMEAYIETRRAWLADGVAAVTGSHEGDPLQVFPDPEKVRSEAPAPDLDVEQEAALREVAGRFGIGGEFDVPSAADTEIIEGGLAWKVLAEQAIANGRLMYAGSPDRTIKPAEHDCLRRHGLDLPEGTSEYGMAWAIAASDPAFDPLEEPVVLPFGYSIVPGKQPVFPRTDEPTGQFQQIGTRYGEPVLLIRIDQAPYFDEEKGKTKNSNPGGSSLLGLVSDYLGAQGDMDSSLGLVTSNTYGGSRVIDAVRAGLRHGRHFTIGMYGRSTLAQHKGEEAAGPPDFNQIPGELHVIASKLNKLAEESGLAQPPAADGRTES